ncbi:protein phosphatase 1B [Leptidea sinapis]|nr:protein phosphatase 1B [Leptidea sinapis]XP_050685245.1 protein phosphatase 1B [Leptidea sinapis]
MGAFLNKPETKKYNESGEGNGLRYGVASMQGWRVEMEDAHHAQLTLNGTLSDWSYFAVFDGHAGARVSAHCADNLLECILQTEEFRRDDIVEAIRAGFLDLDKKMRELPELCNGEEKSGSTAVCAFVSPKQIYIANCGDSRAVLARNGAPIFATRDHKPELPSEKSRIVQAGGTVMIQRVNGSLAVSRALGDYEYKKVLDRGPCEQLVSPEPEVSVHERLETEDEFLVLACDGVWDVMSNEALCAYVHSLLQLTDDLVAVTNQVIDTCLYKGSKDNMSIVLVVFPAAPRPDPEAQRRDRELDDTLRQRLTALIESNAASDDLDDTAGRFSRVLKQLLDENIPGLPPGGGLAAKQGLLDKIYREFYPEHLDSSDTFDCQAELADSLSNN